MAVIAIGDIHGCIATLDLLLDQLEPTVEDELVFIGDYVDRGPNSKAVLDKLIEMEKAGEEGGGPSCVFLRGNHDQMMLDFLDYPDDPDAYELWAVNGGRATQDSYQAAGLYSVPQDHIDFLRRTHLVFEDGEFVFVHAGLNPRMSIKDNLTNLDPQIALWTRGHLRADLSNWEKTVVCGHTPQADPVNSERLINIDTGAVYPHVPGMGRLTAVRLPEREFVRVPYEG